MLKVYGCIVNSHDLRLVGLAAVVGLLASLTLVGLLGHARASVGTMRTVWIGVAATAGGFGIWATHCIALLAYSPGIPSGYDIQLTVVSLLAAIWLTGGGLAIALSRTVPAATSIGGATVGAGIVAMHFIGMAAFEVAGRLQWDPTLVVVSIVLGGATGALALHVALREDSAYWRIAGSLLLVLAICGHHFTAMGAVSVVFDSTVNVSSTVVSSTWLAVAVALVSFGIILLSVFGLYVDVRDRRRGLREINRMRGLANAAIEGLVICDAATIVAVNDSFAALAGAVPDQFTGTELDRYFTDPATVERLLSSPNLPLESTMLLIDGTSIPVELILRPVEFAGSKSHGIAVRDLRDRQKAERHITYLAHHDALTGLPNRASFNEQLDRAIEALEGTDKRLAVLCFDLDRFKEVNDLFGHAAGDALLQAVAKRTTSILEPDQIMARLGGDEFAVIMPEIAQPHCAGLLAERALEILKNESEPSSPAMSVTASIGIAVYPDDAGDRTGLLTQADTALYMAKAAGGATHRFFETAMGAQVRERRLIEHDLRHAVGRGEFRLVYQPQSRIATGEIVGFEALLRWRHPERGDVPPGVFIPIAEESASILAIGEWVLRTACDEASGWKNDLRIAVNVSPHQIHHPAFATLVQEVLEQTGLPAHRLELEITETALVRDLDRALATLRRLKALGVRIAMDDFGTGYSSLSNLRAFPFDKIKVDRSFVKAVDTNEEAATIVRAVVGLGRGLHLPVLAEGVETTGELNFLRDEQCSEAQGYLLGRPADIADFTRYTHADAPTDEIEARTCQDQPSCIEGQAAEAA